MFPGKASAAVHGDCRLEIEGDEPPRHSQQPLSISLPTFVRRARMLLDGRNGIVARVRSASTIPGLKSSLTTVPSGPIVDRQPAASHHHAEASTHRRPALNAHCRRTSRACAPARRAQGHRPGPLHHLSLDCRRLVPGAGTPWPARRGLALVGPGSLDAIAPHHAALTCSAPRAGSRAGAARRQRTLDAACGAATLGFAGRRLFSPLPGKPVRRRGHPASLAQRSMSGDLRCTVGVGMVRATSRVLPLPRSIVGNSR
jgi:hypothetical protein